MFISKDFSDTFLPITLMKWILGLGVIEYPFGQSRASLNLLYSTFSFILAAVSSVMFMRYYYKHAGARTDSNALFFLYIFIYGNLLFYATAIIRERIYRKELKQCFQEINIINKQFEKIGIREKYNRLLMRHLCLAAGIVIVIMFNVITISVNRQANYTIDVKIYRTLMFYYLLIVPSIIELQFISLVSYLRQKFKQLNNFLQKLTGCDSSSTQYAKVFYYKIGLGKTATFKLGQKTNDNVEILTIAKDIHLDLVKVCETVNEIFGLEILIALGVSIGILIITSFDVFCVIIMNIQKWQQGTRGRLLFFLFLFLTIKVLAINHVCYMASEEALCTRDIVCELNEPTTNAEFRAEIDEFILQLMQNPLIFTAHGCFTLNHSFIQSIVGMISTYLIILIQIRFAFEET